MQRLDEPDPATRPRSRRVSGSGQTGAVGSDAHVADRVRSHHCIGRARLGRDGVVHGHVGNREPSRRRRAVTDANGTASTQLTLGSAPARSRSRRRCRVARSRARTATATQVASTDCASRRRRSRSARSSRGSAARRSASPAAPAAVSSRSFRSTRRSTDPRGTSFTVQASGVDRHGRREPNADRRHVQPARRRVAHVDDAVVARADARARREAPCERGDATSTPLIPGARAWMRSRQRTTSGSVPGLSLSVVPSTATVGQLVTLNANYRVRVLVAGSAHRSRRRGEQQGHHRRRHDEPRVRLHRRRLRVDRVDVRQPRRSHGHEGVRIADRHRWQRPRRAVLHARRERAHAGATARRTSPASSTLAICFRRQRARTSTRARRATAARCSTSSCPTRPAS